MVQLRRISNTNRDIEDKVNYFIDRFLHMATFSGFDYRLEIENHHSLVEKILYNVTSGTLPTSDIHETYFKHELFQNEDFWARYPIFTKVKQYFDQYLSTTKKQLREEITTNPDFINALDQLRRQLITNEREFIYEAMWSHMLCQYPLNEHEHIAKIDMISRWMVSEAYFSGMTFTDLHEAVNRIFAKDKNVPFPFPPEIKTAQQRRKFLEAGTLENQLAGFKRTMERDNERCLVLMKASADAIFPEDIFFAYDDVTIIGSEHPKIVELRRVKADKDYFTEYLAPGQHSFILAEISYFSADSVRQLMYQRTQKSLEYLSAIAGCQVELDRNGAFVGLTKRWKVKAFSLPVLPQKKRLTPENLADLKNSPYQVLEKYRNSPATKWFLGNESSFIEAHRRNSISGYWKYLEALLPLGPEGKKQVKSTVSLLLILNEMLNQKQRVIQTLYDTVSFFGGGDQLFGIPWEDLKKTRKALQRGLIPMAIRKSKYPFVRELLRELDNSDTVDHLRNSVEYYKAILIEAYSVRNHEFHGGKANRSAAVKLKRTMPRLVQRIRWIIMDAIKESPELTFPEIIDVLRNRARAKLS